MKMQIFKKGALYSADCNRCGSTMFTHEWFNDDHNDRRDAMQAGTLQCNDCSGHADADTFHYCGRQYAGWYSMPGYLDCTDVHYDKNLRRLKSELRDFYGDED